MGILKSRRSKGRTMKVELIKFDSKFDEEDRRSGREKHDPFKSRLDLKEKSVVENLIIRK